MSHRANTGIQRANATERALQAEKHSGQLPEFLNILPKFDSHSLFINYVYNLGQFTQTL